MLVAVVKVPVKSAVPETLKAGTVTVRVQLTATVVFSLIVMQFLTTWASTMVTTPVARLVMVQAGVPKM